MTDYVTKYTSDRRKEGSRAREPRWAVLGSCGRLHLRYFSTLISVQTEVTWCATRFKRVKYLGSKKSTKKTKMYIWNDSGQKSLHCREALQRRLQSKKLLPIGSISACYIQNTLFCSLKPLMTVNI